MPSFTISGSNDFKKSVQKTAKKLGLSYGAYLRKAHRACLETLTSKDFEKAKKLIELQESKERLSSLREKETILLREKAYKNKNLRRIFHDIEDPEIRREVERIAELREEEADNQIRLYEEINPSYEPKKKKMFSKEKKKHDPLRLKEEKLVEKFLDLDWIRDKLNTSKMLQIKKKFLF
jgi:hypothetical protein